MTLSHPSGNGYITLHCEVSHEGYRAPRIDYEKEAPFTVVSCKNMRR